MNHQKSDRAGWLEARMRLLAKEKDLTARRDQLSEERRALPWVHVEKPYAFDTVQGKATLSELFRGRKQLIVYHFMFAPEWEVGCKSCSFWADGFNGAPAHLEQRDVTFVAISRAPLAKLQAFRRRLNWSFEWASSYQSDFNFDFQVSFDLDKPANGASYNYGSMKPPETDMPGFSVFAKDDEKVFHTYSTYGRGIEAMNPVYPLLDLVPKGRDETVSAPMKWLKLRDEYAR